MNSLNYILEKAQLSAENIDLDTSGVFRSILSFPANTESRQIIHKLNRILIEIEFEKKNRHKFISLTQREKEIITLVVQGNNNPQIANKLFISRCTVEQHRKNINRKLKVNSLPEICVFAYAFNMV